MVLLKQAGSVAALRQRCDLHQIKARDAVGLGPQRNPARLSKGLVGHAEQRIAVIGDGEPLALGAKAECMPLVGGYLQIGASQLFTAAVDDAIEADVILERV